MKKRLTILFLVLSSSLLLHLAAQNVIKFSKVYNIPPIDTVEIPNVPTSILPTSGGYLLYGSTDDTAYPHLYRVYAMKIDTMGNEVWYKMYGKSGYAYSADALPWGGGGVSVPWGGDIVIGYIDTAYLDTAYYPNYKLALFRFDDNGDTLWTKIYNDTASIFGWYIKVARKYHFIIGGEWVNPKRVLCYTPTIILTDSSGKKLWQKIYSIPGHMIYITGIDTCKDGGFVVFEEVDDSNYECGAQIAVMKVDSLGNTQWTKFISNSNCNALGGGGDIIKRWRIYCLRFAGY